MSQQAAAAKPSLQGVRIKARKRAVKASAKHEPTGTPRPPPRTACPHPHRPSVFRDQLLKHLENVPADDFEAITNKVVQAGSTLEYLKYADALFEILIVGGLLQPGGQYIDDGTPLSPFSILNAKEPVEASDVKQYVEVFNKLIRR